ncbi:hypothetical protein [Desulfuromonas sp. TF]|uniref:hypothetical protein n=1 Tax=Desulfuromonas sp. TF TaxID=1232410 RepID=UPI0003FF0A70|nr:hypothetical protein [Desulfuromonas sp. TF]
MAGINDKYEGSASACMRFWAGLKDRFYEEGLSAPPGAQCPYPQTSFAANHWRRGQSQDESPASPEGYAETRRR